MYKILEVPNLALFFLSIISIILSIILFLTIFFYKKKRLKSDFLLLERFLFIFVFNICFIILKFNYLVGNHFQKTENLQQILFIFLSVFYINILSVNIELYKEINYPFYNFINVFNKKWKNLFWEGFTIFFTLGRLFLNKFIKEEVNTIEKDINFKVILCIISITSLIYLVFFSLINFYVCIKNIKTLSNFQNESKGETKFKTIMNLLFSLIQIGYIIIHLIEKLNFFKYPLNEIYTFYFLIMIFLETTLNMIFTRNSDFYYYTLGRKDLSNFYNIFGCNDFYKPIMSINNEQKYNNLINNNINLNCMLLSNNDQPIKKDNILYYFHKVLKLRNISQFNLEVSEYCLNLSIACLTSIFEKMKEYKITEDEFDNRNSSLIPVSEELNKNLDKKGKYYEFEFNQNSFKDNDKGLLTKLKINSFNKNTNFIDSFNVNVKYFQYEKFQSIIKNRDINLSELIKSLLSHSCEYPFLICKNSRNEYFKTMETLSLKTNDKKYIIEIFSNILNENSDNYILEQYLKHLLEKKITFIPILIGAFKIKINHMNPFTIFISRNSIMENLPKEIFNYWQLMRYIPLKKSFEKISTSKDRTSLCITQDNLFNNENKISIKDYLNFTSILIEDTNFLSLISSKNFDLLIMYYEFDHNNPYLEDYLNYSRATSKIRKTEFEFYNNNNLNKKNDDIDFRPSEFNNMKYDDKSNFSTTNINSTINNANKDRNGFDCKFGGIKCMLFFTFEKILNFNGFSISFFDYFSFSRKIIEYFDNQYED